MLSVQSSVNRIRGSLTVAAMIRWSSIPGERTINHRVYNRKETHMAAITVNATEASSACWPRGFSLRLSIVESSSRPSPVGRKYQHIRAKE